MNPFAGALAAASNITVGTGTYTADQFLADFPQFSRTDTGESLTPPAMLEMFVANANAAIQPGRWYEKWRYACGLYVAHYAALYLRTYAPGSDAPGQAAASSNTVGVVKAATLGDASVTYDTAALTAGTERWGSLNATQYGQLLATEARLAGMGGTFVL